MELHPLAEGLKTGRAVFGCMWDEGICQPGAGFLCVNEQGERVPVQSRITAYWPDGSVKWTAHSGSRARMGNKIEITQVDREPEFPEEKKITLTTAGAGYTVDNGVWTMDIPGPGAYLFSAVRKGKKPVAEKGRPELILEEPAEVDDCPARVEKKYHGRIDTVEIEERGDWQVTVKYTGTHERADGETRLPFIIRVRIGAGEDRIHFTHTFLYDGDENRDFLRGIGIAFDAPDTWGVNENGDIYPAHESPAYLEGLNWLRHLYEIGGIDPNFATIDSTNWSEAEYNNKAFMRFDCLDNGYRLQEWFEKEKGVTDVIVGLIPGLKKADGSITLWPQNPGFSGEVVVTKAVKEEDLPKVMKFLDWCNGAEGQMLLNWGVEGVTYWLDEEGFRTNTPADGSDQSQAIKTIQGSLNQLGMNVPGDLCVPAKTTVLREEYTKGNEEFAKYAVANPCYPLISETNVAFGTQLSQLISDAAVQYIACKIDEAGLRAVWQQWSDEGGAIITEEYNAAYHAAQQ